MSGNKGPKKEDADFELEDDVEPSTEPTIDVEQEMGELAEKSRLERTTQRELPTATKASMAAPPQVPPSSNPPNSPSTSHSSPSRTRMEAPKIQVEKVAPPRGSSSEKRAYKEPIPTSSEDIYKAMKKPNSYGFARKIVFVAVVAAGIFYGQRFFQKTKELVPFPDAPKTQNTTTEKSIGAQIEEVKNAVFAKEEIPQPVEVMVDSDFVDIQVLVDGQAITVSDKKFTVDSGKKYQIVMKRNGYFDFQSEIQAVAGKPIKITPSFEKEFVSGFITIETTPESKITILQEGKVVKEGNTPLIGWKAPVGKYRLVIENSFISYRSEEEFHVYNSLTTSIRRQLSAK